MNGIDRCTNTSIVTLRNSIEYRSRRIGNSIHFTQSVTTRQQTILHQLSAEVLQTRHNQLESYRIFVYKISCCLREPFLLLLFHLVSLVDVSWVLRYSKLITKYAHPSIHLCLMLQILRLCNSMRKKSHEWKIDLKWS